MAACLTLSVPLTVGLVLLGVDIEEGEEQGTAVGDGPGAVGLSTDRVFGEAWVYAMVGLCALWVCLIPCLRAQACWSCVHQARVCLCGHYGGEG